FFVEFCQIPATDLDIAFGVAQKTGDVAQHALFEGRRAGFRRPLTRHDRRHLHQTHLTVAAFLPGTEVSLFIDDAPDEVGIDLLAGGFTLEQRIVSMNPVLIQEIESASENKDREDYDDETLHSDRAKGFENINLQNERYAVSTESGSDRVTILAISILAIGGDPVAIPTYRDADLILKLRHHLLGA